MRIGIGIVTYQRFDRFKECFENLLRNRRDVEEIIVVDDASIKDRERYDEYFSSIMDNSIHIWTNSSNKGVGYSKNRIMKYFYEKGYDYFFTLEDDINILSPEVFNKYIEAVQVSGMQYINFALHGANTARVPTSIEINNFKFLVYPNNVGAFTIYTPKLIKEVGYHDEKFYNAWEHVDYTYRASLKGLTTKFWSFIDIPDSNFLLQEQENALMDSSIRPREDWGTNIDSGLKYWLFKHGVSLFDIPR
jgi:GT2 family glycosyltransferase